MPSLSQVRAVAPRPVRRNLKDFCPNDRGLTSASPWLRGLPQAAPGCFDLILGGGAVGPGRVPDALARLERLVHGEEVVDLQPVELRYVLELAHLLLPRVAGRDTD